MKIDKIYLGNNLDVLKTFDDNSIDSVVTDPPYGINFMNKKWDYDIPSVELWREVIRVLKPGGHILCACGTRTQHRMAVNIEEAGFEIRDIVAWIYGSGFPKSVNISKNIDRKLGVESTIIGKGISGTTERKTMFKAKELGKNGADSPFGGEYNITTPSTPQAKQYEGWGTALKPAMELWTLARKPFNTTVADNVLKYGTGGINIDGCRVGTEEGELTPRNNKDGQNGVFNASGGYVEPNQNGRFPANLIHDGSAEVVEGFPSEAGGGLRNSSNNKKTEYTNTYTPNEAQYSELNTYGDSGSASRFFYCAKSSQSERNMGLYGFEEEYTASAEFRPNHMEKAKNGESGNPFGRWQPKRNIHPTVKPLELMRYLVRLITPKDGLCLDPYVGSGTTAIAAKQEKMRYIGIELDEKYHAIAEARIKAAVVQYDIFDYL